jgi:hypothetical protein
MRAAAAVMLPSEVPVGVEVEVEVEADADLPSSDLGAARNVSALAVAVDERGGGGGIN